jgi:hypothetical protein
MFFISWLDFPESQICCESVASIVHQGHHSLAIPEVAPIKSLRWKSVSKLNGLKVDTRIPFVFRASLRCYVRYLFEAYQLTGYVHVIPPAISKWSDLRLALLLSFTDVSRQSVWENPIIPVRALPQFFPATEARGQNQLASEVVAYLPLPYSYLPVLLTSGDRQLSTWPSASIPSGRKQSVLSCVVAS